MRTEFLTTSAPATGKDMKDIAKLCEEVYGCTFSTLVAPLLFLQMHSLKSAENNKILLGLSAKKEPKEDSNLGHQHKKSKHTKSHVAQLIDFTYSLEDEVKDEEDGAKDKVNKPKISRNDDPKMPPSVFQPFMQQPMAMPMYTPGYAQGYRQGFMAPPFGYGYHLYPPGQPMFGAPHLYYTQATKNKKHSKSKDKSGLV